MPFLSRQPAARDLIREIGVIARNDVERFLVFGQDDRMIAMLATAFGPLQILHGI